MEAFKDYKDDGASAGGAEPAASTPEPAAQATTAAQPTPTATPATTAPSKPTGDRKFASPLAVNLAAAQGKDI